MGGSEYGCLVSEGEVVSNPGGAERGITKTFGDTLAARLPLFFLSALGAGPISP